MVIGQQTWARWSELLVGDPSVQYKYWETLAREQGWTISFAENVFGEYRKLLFLAITVPHPLLVPAPLQAALDLHRSLPSWRELPERAELERRLHLSGTRDQTRASYLNAFGAYPPESIWPSGIAPSKPKESYRGRHWMLGLLVCAVMGLIWGDILPGALITPAIFGLVIVVVSLMKRWHPSDGRPSREKSSDSDSSSSSWNESDSGWSSDEGDSSSDCSDSDSSDSGCDSD